MNKFCRKCLGEFSTNGFAKDKTTKDGLQRWCRTCHYDYIKSRPGYKEKQAAAHKRRWNSGVQRDYHLRKSFGISLNQYNDMLAAQNGVCAICDKIQENAKQKNLGVDHNHVTGLVRGLLCQNCNTAIGLMADNPDIAARAIDYLRRHGARNVRAAPQHRPLTFCG